MNKSILLGRLTKAPEIRFSQKSNIKVATFTLAVNRKYVPQGEGRQADFINIVAYSKLADFAEKYLKQGLQICLSGRIQVRSYEDNNGQKRYVTEIIAEEIDFADSLKKQGPDISILNGNGLSENTENSLQDASDDFVISSDDELPF